MTTTTASTSTSVYDPLPGVHRISNSERTAFKRCRRSWSWSYRDRYVPTDVNRNFWIGTGFHYALEQYHGYDRDPFDAWRNYVTATLQLDQAPPSYDVEEDSITVIGMLDHYLKRWLPSRNEFQTFRVNNKPQVEIEFSIYIMDCPCHTPAWPVYYVGTFDRVVIDPYARLWVQDYKTAERFDTDKLPTDGQISSYSLAARVMYQRAFEGVLYTQFRKRVADYPKRNKDGSFSIDQRQSTTHSHYVEALTAEYGHIPEKYANVVNHFASLETEDGDQYIRQDLVRRDAVAVENELQSMVDEFTDMLSTPRIYKSAMQGCTNCTFYHPCVAKDSGADYSYLLAEDYRQVTNARVQTWRNLLPV